MEKLIKLLNELTLSEWEIIRDSVDLMFEIEKNKKIADIKINDFEALKSYLYTKLNK